MLVTTDPDFNVLKGGEVESGVEPGTSVICAAGGTANTVSHSLPQWVVGEQGTLPPAIVRVPSVTEGVIANETKSLPVVSMTDVATHLSVSAAVQGSNVLPGNAIGDADTVEIGLIYCVAWSWVVFYVGTCIWAGVLVPSNSPTHSGVSQALRTEQN